MQFQLILGLVIIALVILCVYLKKTKGHQKFNLPTVSQPNPPAVSEDVNLPLVNNPNLPVIKNELESNGSQQQ